MCTQEGEIPGLFFSFGASGLVTSQGRALLGALPRRFKGYPAHLCIPPPRNLLGVWTRICGVRLWRVGWVGYILGVFEIWNHKSGYDEIWTLQTVYTAQQNDCGILGCHQRLGASTTTVWLWRGDGALDTLMLVWWSLDSIWDQLCLPLWWIVVTSPFNTTLIVIYFEMAFSLARHRSKLESHSLRRQSQSLFLAVGLTSETQ